MFVFSQISPPKRESQRSTPVAARQWELLVVVVDLLAVYQLLSIFIDGGGGHCGVLGLFFLRHDFWTMIARLHPINVRLYNAN